MFEGLNAIPWAELTHAYGSAEEVPMWLRRLTSDDARVRKEAMNDLWGSICHQNWICPATGYAVSYLIELLQAPTVQDKHEILGLLADITSCEPLHEPTWRDNPRVPSWVVPAHVPFKDAQAETAAGLSLYLALLDHPEPAVRMEATHILVSLPNRGEGARAQLLDALEREQDDRVRANLVLALGQLAQIEARDDERVLFTELLRAGTSDLVGFCAVLELTLLAKTETPQPIVDILVAVMQEEPESLRPYMDLPCGGSYPWSAARWALYEIGPARLRFAIPALIAILRRADSIAAEMIANLLLFAAFGSKPQPGQKHRPVQELTAEQRTTLEGIVSTKAVWRYLDFADVLKAYGLPSKRDELAAYLRREDHGSQASEQLYAPPRRTRTQDRFDAYVQCIEERFPDLPIGRYVGRFHPPARNNDVITVNDTIIFRFPRHARAMEEMEREIAILRGLQGRLPLPIPNPTYSSQGTRKVGRAFMGYEKLPGKPLYREMLESVDGEETAQRLADQLAGFLRALHSVPADVFAIPLPVKNGRATWALMYERIRDRLFSHMRPDTRQQVSARFERFLNEARSFEWTPALIHGDFGSGNILYDAKRRTISGIIDFSSAGLGDPATDLAALITPHSYGEDLLPRLEPGYPGIADLADRARFYVGTFALQAALFGVEHVDREAFERGIAEYA